MEWKAPLYPIPRNKKAPKAPESGTPRVGNQLVRMRSPNHLLKDIETGTAPTRHFLTLTRATQPKSKKQEATPGPLFFSCFPIARTLSRKDMRERSGSHPSASNPHGASLPHSSIVRRGIATARTKPLAPPYAKLPTTAHVSPVAGHQLSRPAQRRFHHHKKHLRFLSK